jgi:aspartyl-tRNA synthetase
MSFVERNQVLETFEGLTRHLFREILNVELAQFPIMDYQEAMSNYGSDKPDIRFEMCIKDITSLAQG